MRGRTVLTVFGGMLLAAGLVLFVTGMLQANFGDIATGLVVGAGSAFGLGYLWADWEVTKGKDGKG